MSETQDRVRHLVQELLDQASNIDVLKELPDGKPKISPADVAIEQFRIEYERNIRASGRG